MLLRAWRVPPALHKPLRALLTQVKFNRASQKTGGSAPRQITSTAASASRPTAYAAMAAPVKQDLLAEVCKLIPELTGAPNLQHATARLLLLLLLLLSDD